MCANTLCSKPSAALWFFFRSLRLDYSALITFEVHKTSCCLETLHLKQIQTNVSHLRERREKVYPTYMNVNEHAFSKQNKYSTATASIMSQCSPNCVPRHISVPQEFFKCAVKNSKMSQIAQNSISLRICAIYTLYDLLSFVLWHRRLKKSQSVTPRNSFRSAASEKSLGSTVLRHHFYVRSNHKGAPNEHHNRINVNCITISV